jgi:hypothetical protein
VESGGNGRWSSDAARDADQAASKLGVGLQDGRQHARQLSRRDGQHRARGTLILFADTSALGSAYLGDEIDAEWIGNVLFEGSDPIVICELADVEFASLPARAKSDGRIDEAGLTERLDAYDDHTADDGPIGVVPLTHATPRWSEHGNWCCGLQCGRSMPCIWPQPASSLMQAMTP